MTLSRKQREIAQRHELFLDIAKNLLQEEGFHLLSMERIAELAEYSKGTVYQHFCCKEEILFQLCSQELSELHNLIKTASQIDGNFRDRITAIFYTHQIWSSSDKNHADLQQHLSMHGVKEKVTEESIHKHDTLQSNIIGIANAVVDQAIKSGELKKPKNLTSAEIVFALWALSSGGHALQTPEMALDKIGISQPAMTLMRSMALMLDGLDWQPLHSEAKLKKLLKTIDALVKTGG